MADSGLDLTQNETSLVVYWDSFKVGVWIGFFYGKKGREGEDVVSKGGRCKEEEEQQQQQKSECYT